MPRAFLVVMDGVGIGGAPGADCYRNGSYSDYGANTLGHIAEVRAEAGNPLKLPNLGRMGLSSASKLATGDVLAGINVEPTGWYGAATSVSKGKDTQSGHWELAGLPVRWDWHYFPETIPTFPEDFTRTIANIAGTDGVLGDCHASGTEIIFKFGDEHIRSGKPICYTSLDSVLQIAAHEQTFGLARLIDLCEAIAPLCHSMKVGRVIARPFIGDADVGFTRTSNRRDFVQRPPQSVLTNWVCDAGRNVHAIGKIGDIFAMSGISDLRKGDEVRLMQHLYDRVEEAEEGSLVFANFIEFDSLFGHRRDVDGFAAALEWFDLQIGAALTRLRFDDMMIITADHGNDPTWPGSDHTRERVPVLVVGPGSGSLGVIRFADVGVTLAEHLGVPCGGDGESFLSYG